MTSPGARTILPAMYNYFQYPLPKDPFRSAYDERYGTLGYDYSLGRLMGRVDTLEQQVAALLASRNEARCVTVTFDPAFLSNV